MFYQKKKINCKKSHIKNVKDRRTDLTIQHIFSLKYETHKNYYKLVRQKKTVDIYFLVGFLEIFNVNTKILKL